MLVAKAILFRKERMRRLVVPCCVSMPLMFWMGSAMAQVTGDNSLRIPTQVRPQGNIFRIRQGTPSGRFLFHSFEDFSLRRSQTARFEAPSATKAIIARVAGSDPSQINGTIQAPGQADIFFLNPNGIRFGRRAQLNIGGSFIASTANQIQFDNGTRFRANRNTDAPPLLRISTPIGLQVGPNPAPITVQGPGHGLVIDPDTLETIPRNRPTELLRVPAMRSLALIGGDVILSGGNLQASGGRIYLAALGAHQTVSVKQDGLGWKPKRFETTQLGDILLENAASAITNGNGGGEIQLQGRFVDILDGSTLLANSFGTRSGRGVSLDAAEGSLIAGVWVDPKTQTELFPSSIFSEVGLDQSSNGGAIRIWTPELSIQEGGQVSTSTFGFGRGGDIQVISDRVSILGGTETFGASGFYLDVIDEFTEGKGGNFKLQQAQKLRIAEGGTLSASTFGPGQSGLIDIQSKQVVLEGGAPSLGASSILAQVEESGSAMGININSDRLSILGGAQISTSTFGSGDGGALRINSSHVHLDGSSPLGNPGGLFSTVGQPGTGNGGNIRIFADHIRLRNGAEINSSTRFQGNAGDLFVQSDLLDIRDQRAQSTGLFAAVEKNATGQGATLTVNAKTLLLRQGGQIVSGTLGSGNGGNVFVNAERIDLSGQNSQARSGIFASAINGTGRGGDIIVRSKQSVIQDGATINASNFPSGPSRFSPGAGAAGSVNVFTRSLILQNQGTINASTAAGDRGNLLIESDLVLLNNRSRIQTDTTSTLGGNIEISARQLFGLGNSDITANAIQGRGGQISITAEQIFGVQSRSQLTPLSDLTASSALGPQFAGAVQVNILEPTPNPEQTFEKKDIIDTSQLIARSCFQHISANRGKLIVKGSGGLAAQPYGTPTTFFNTLDLPNLAPQLIPKQPLSAKLSRPHLFVTPSLKTASPVIAADQWVQFANGTLALGRQC